MLKRTRAWGLGRHILDGLRAGSMEAAVGEAFNLASGKEMRVIDMSNLVNELTGNEGGICRVPRRKWDTKTRLLAKVDKARELIGCEPRTECRVGLEQTVASFRETEGRLFEWAPPNVPYGRALAASAARPPGTLHQNVRHRGYP